MANSCFGCWTCFNSFVEDHKHPLSFTQNPKAPYKCDGCKEIGSGPSYKCVEKSCNYQLHSECKDLSSADGSSATHSLFSGKEFIFQKLPPENVGSCVACGMNVQGFRYHHCPPKKNAFVELFVPTKELVLHPCCFRLPRNKTSEGLSTNNGVITNLELKEEAPSACLICQRKKIFKQIKGWAYVSTCGNEYCYHVKCVKELLDKKFDQQRDGTNTTTSNLLLDVTQKAVKIGKDITVVLTLIIQALYGDPISAMVTLVMYFFDKRNFFGRKKLTAG